VRNRKDSLPGCRAFGVTVWEVFSYGEVPFGDLTNTEILNAACNGHRPPRPATCSGMLTIYSRVEQKYICSGSLRVDGALLDKGAGGED
jgi:hypothetical protein